MPAPVRIGAWFVGWMTLTADEILDPGNVPLVEPGDAAPNAANATLTAVWERFDPTTGEGEWELTERGMRCRVEAAERPYEEDGECWWTEPSRARCSYELPGRRQTFRALIVPPVDEAWIWYNWAEWRRALI